MSYQPQSSQPGAFPPQPPQAAPKSNKLLWVVLGIVIGIPTILLGGCVACVAVLGVVGSQQPESSATRAGATAPVPSSPTPTPAPLTPAEKLESARGMVKESGSTASISRGMELLKEIPKGAAEYREAQQLLRQGEKFHKSALASERAREEADAKRRREEALLGPKPKNSEWDGSVRCVDKYLKQTLNDYDSAEYLEWSPVFRMDTADGPYWAVRLKLRAADAFGGKIVKNIIFFIRDDQVIKHTDL